MFAKFSTSWWFSAPVGGLSGLSHHNPMIYSLSELQIVDNWCRISQPSPVVWSRSTEGSSVRLPKGRPGTVGRSVAWPRSFWCRQRNGCWYHPVWIPWDHGRTQLDMGLLTGLKAAPDPLKEFRWVKTWLWYAHCLEAARIPISCLHLIIFKLHLFRV